MHIHTAVRGFQNSSLEACRCNNICHWARFHRFKIQKHMRLSGLTVGGLETETCKHCTGDSSFKDTILLIVSSDRLVSWAACASWKACYPF